jgi:eukaryotic-like serine/threonine-protein kinase
VRFERRALLGRGATGAVYRAFDAELRCEVALKTLLGVSEDLAEELKFEFRILRGVSHPNLVQLYDLVVTDEEAFFTMELVEGVDVVRYVRGDLPARTPLDPAGHARLRDVFEQLVIVIETLHAADRVHRDLKPSNVIVMPNGHVMVLDFGLAAMVHRDADAAERAEMAGTFPYMAPEQIWGLPPTPAIDWYALGVVMFEALSGVRGFEGSPVAVLRMKEHGPLPSPGEVIPSTKGGVFDALVRALLDPDPGRRQGAAAIRAALAGRHASATPAPLRVPDEVFVGRDAELRTLAGWLDSVARQALVAHVVGPSGIGKTALLRRFLQRATVLVLASRCHPQEKVPYKALDGAVEAIARHLRRARIGAAELEVEDVHALLSLFPALQRVDALVLAPGGDDAGLSQREQQRRAFAAFRALVAGLAKRGPVVLWIDDAHWGDRDSALALVEALRGPGAPRVLLLLSYRGDEASESALLRELERSGIVPDHTLDVHALEAAQTSHLAAALLERDVTDPAVERIVHQAAGSPFLVEQLSRYVRSHEAPVAEVELADAILDRIGILGASARPLAELVAVAGGALEIAQVLALLSGPDSTPLVYRMREQCMLRTVTTRPKSVEVYHDRIRETLLAAMPLPRRRELHRQVADCLQRQPAADPDALLEHLLGAGDEAAAAGAAVTAAERNVAALAFGRGAELYGLALRLRAAGDADWPLMARHAETLANAGLGADAGRAHEAAADAALRIGASAAHALALRAAAARELLCAGEFEAGSQALRRMLAHAGLSYPRSAARAVARLLASRVRIAARGMAFRARREADVGADTLAQIDGCWAATIGLNAFDAVRSAAFQARHTLLALDAGESTRVVRALTAEAVYRAAEGRRAGRARAATLIAQVEALATESADERVLAFARLCSGVARYFGGDWDGSIEQLGAAEQIFRSLRGVAWELNNCRAYRLWALAWLGRTEALADEVPGATADARARGDVLAEIGVASGHANLGWLLADRPEEARLRARAAIGHFPERDFQSPHYVDLLAQARIDLYEDDAWGAWARLRDALPRVRRAHLLRLQLFRIETRVLAGSCALAAACTPAKPPARCAGWTRPRLLREVARSVSRLRAEDLPVGPALGDTLAAAATARAGRLDVAATQLAAAAVALDRLGLGLYAGVARYYGARLASRSSDDGWAVPGVAAPARVAAMLLPGLHGVCHGDERLVTHA